MDENTLITIRGRGSVPCKIDTIDFVLTLTAFGKEGKELTEKEEKMRNDLFSAIEKIRKEIRERGKKQGIKIKLGCLPTSAIV